MIAEIIAIGDRWLTHSLALNRSLPHAFRMQLVEHREPAVRAALVVGAQDAPRELFGRLIGDRNPKVREYLAQSDDVPADLRARLAADPDPEIRATLAQWWPQAPQQVRRILLTDAVDTVRAAACSTYYPRYPHPVPPADLLAALLADPVTRAGAVRHVTLDPASTMRRQPMASVMGLLGEREAAARVRVEELQAEADRVLAELDVAEAVLERRVIARVELAEALTGGGDAADVPAQQVQDPAPAITMAKVPVAGSIVPRRGEGMTVEALAPDYRRIVSLLESDPGDGEGVSAKELAARLGLELVPAKIEGVRSKARRLVERGWLAVSPSGRFMPRQPIGTVPAPVRAGRPGGRDGGS